ncbi:MAG: hypothetical protein Q9183_006673 [Haloplaca sp. 2 TL-2023]
MEPRSEDFGEAPSKDVWGNEGPRRKERERMRIAADDPMAAMQKGVTELREVEKERHKWQRERDQEIRELAAEQRRRRRKSKRQHDEEDLDNFTLDAPAKDRRDVVMDIGGGVAVGVEAGVVNGAEARLILDTLEIGPTKQTVSQTLSVLLFGDLVYTAGTAANLQTLLHNAKILHIYADLFQCSQNTSPPMKFGTRF